MLEEKQSPLEALRSAQLHLHRHPEQIPQLAQGVKVALQEARPTPPATRETRRAPVRSWAGFVFSGVGR
jgi:hypothetical protein